MTPSGRISENKFLNPLLFLLQSCPGRNLMGFGEQKAKENFGISAHFFLLKKFYSFNELAFLFFNWRIVALQYCVGFFCTTRVSFKYTFIPLPLESPSQHRTLSQTPFADSSFPLAIYFTHSSVYMGLPWWFSSQKSACNAGDSRFHPWVGKIPWRRTWQPTPVSLPKKIP